MLLADTSDLFFQVFHVWFQANPFHNPAARSGYFWEFVAIPIADEGIIEVESIATEERM